LVKNGNIKERRKSLYREPIMRALNEVYDETKVPVSMQQLLSKIAENEKRALEDYQKTQAANKGQKKKEGSRSEYDFVTEPKQSTVWRNLDALIADGKVLRAESGKAYLPNSLEVCRSVIKQEIIDHVNFAQNMVHRMAETTFLVDVKGEYLDLAKQLFRKFLGPEHCFGIVEFNGYLMILAKFEIEARKDDEGKKKRIKEQDDLYYDILETVQKAYEREENEHHYLNMRKRKRSTSNNQK